MSLKTDLDARAVALLKDTKEADLELRVTAFKAVSLYYLGTQRTMKGAKPPEDDGGPTFLDLVKKTKHVQPGGNA